MRPLLPARLLAAVLCLPAVGYALPGALEELQNLAGQTQDPTKAQAPEPVSSTTETYRLGDTEIAIVTSRKSGKAEHLTFFNMHDNEQTSVNAAMQILEESGGTIVELRHNGQRRITFKAGGTQYSFDPNRIFTPEGLKKTVEPARKEGQEAVAAFSKRLVDAYISRWKAPVIAVHNNTDGSYSIDSYKNGKAINPKLDRDDFFFVTSQAHFAALRDANYNAVLQDGDVAPDSELNDGSLSIYCGQRDVAYVNVEAEFGHKDVQVQMLRKLVKMFGEK